MFELSPGKTAMPFHHHLATEEALYVLSGQGMLRLGAERCTVGPDDYVAFPPGKDPHQLTNTGSTPLRYLVFSTKPPADIIVYPDSDKVGAMAGEGKDTWVRFFSNGSQVDYWHGEPSGTGASAEAPAPETPDSDPTASGAADGDAQGTDDAQEADDDLEERIDDEIAALKKKLGLSGTRGSKRGKGPKRGTAERKVVDDALDELERLKRTLDGD